MNDKADRDSISAIQRYWNARIHDLKMTRHEVGTREFFDDLEHYRFEKLHYLPRLVDFGGFGSNRLLEVGMRHRHRPGALRKRRGAGDGHRPVRNGHRPGTAELRCTGCHPWICGSPTARRCPYPDASFDHVYGHGVVQYTADAGASIRECHRVLKPGGTGIFMVYNRISWLNALSKVMKVALEHEDAPCLRKLLDRRVQGAAGPLRRGAHRPRAFPGEVAAAQGWKGAVQRCVRRHCSTRCRKGSCVRFGWHLMAFCRK
jgi:hypothetical protein